MAALLVDLKLGQEAMPYHPEHLVDGLGAEVGQV